MMLSERQMEAVECEGSMCLSAGAGTGKTLTLVAKYMEYLNKVESSSNILALTFTDKAAAEMRERVRKKIIEMGGDRVEERLEDLSWSTIQTFHAFCAQIIRDFPLDTGIDPGFTVVDEAQMNLIISKAGDKLLNSDDPDITAALNKAMMSVGIRRMPKLFMKLYKKRDLTDTYFARLLDGDSSAAVRQASEDLVEDAWWLLATDRKVRVCVEGFRDVLQRHPQEPFLASVSDDVRVLCSPEPSREEVVKSAIHLFDSLPQRSPSTGLEGDKDYFKKLLNDLKEQRKEYKIKEIIDGNRPELDVMVIEFLTALRTVNQALMAEITRLKRERNGIDYDDMLHAVHRAFKKDPEFVRKYFSSQYKYILIDETQDTDQVQLDIVKSILGDAEGKNDRLFVVGDPKQSIYFFRDVDVSLYKETRNYILESLGGSYLPLDKNHRSAPQIVSLVNSVFEKLMTSDSRPWEFKYESVAVTEKRKDHQGSVELHLIDPRLCNGPKQDAIAQANLVASIIKSLVDDGRMVYVENKDGSYSTRPAEYKDVTILLRRRTNIFYYERALKMLGIPYRVHRGLGFFARQEVLDLYMVLRFLNDESDDVALYGILRSPYFGLSDSQQHLIYLAGEGTWFERLKKAAESDSGLAEARNKLENWMQYARWEPVGDLASRIVADSNIQGVYGGLINGQEIRANLNLLRDRLRELQNSGMITLSEAVDCLRNSIEEESREGGAQLEESKAVEIMTVHAAKGLERPIVIVPEMESKPRPVETDPVEVDRSIGLGVKVIDPLSLDLEPDAAMKHIKLQWKLKAEAEFQRLMYVAMTRARDHLIMTGMNEAVGDGKNPILDGSSWFHFLYGALGISGKDVSNGKRCYTDSLGVGGTLRIFDVEPDLGGAWQEGTEYSVPEWLTSLPMASPPAALTYQPPKKINPSKLGSASMDGGRDGEEEVEEDDEYQKEDNKEFGIIVHAVFQGRPTSVVMMEHGKDDPKMARDIDEMYRKFMQSELMQDVVEDYKEIPYTGKRVDRDEVGQIDRLVKKKDGSWFLIDYKTGAPSDSELEGKKQRYSGQLNAYCKAIEEMRGIQPRAFLYFTNNGKVVEIQRKK